MREFTKDQLQEILAKHKKWVFGEDGGERADLSGANLSGAYLSDANLSGANLSDAYLSDANLSDANLSDANLSDANLRGANLRGANLSDAYLSDANLSDANLSGAYLSGAYLSDIRTLNGASGNREEIKAIQCGLWPVTYTAEVMQIGCQKHQISEWWSFSDKEISQMDTQAKAWWKIWKPILKTIIETSPAIPGCSKEEGDAMAAKWFAYEQEQKASETK